MDNFDNAINATETAFQSAGSAMKESQTYMENSIEAHKKALEAEYENLVNSIPLEQIEKKLIDIGTALLKLVNSDIVQLIAKVTALVTIGGLVLKGLTSLTVLIPTLSSEITAWAISVVGLNASLTTTETIMAALTTTMLANPLFWGAVAVASIVAIVKIVDALTVSFEEQREALEKSTKAYKEAQDEVENLEEKLKRIAKQLDEVNQKKLQITDTNELNRLSQQTKELTNQERILKNQLAIAQSKAEATERELRATAQQTQQQTTTANIQGTNVHNGKTDTIFTATGTRQEIFGKAVQEMAELNSKIQANEVEMQRLTQIYGEGSSQVGVYIAQNEELQQKLWDLKDGTIQYAEDLTKVIDTLGDFTVTIDGQTYSVQQLLDLWGLFGGTSNDVANANSNVADSAEEAEEATEEEANAAEALEEAFEKAIKPLSDIENSYSTVAKAVKEFNEQGGFSASTIKKITQLDSDWLEVLNKVLAGEVNLNEASQLVAEAQKQEAISTLQAQAAQDMKNVAIGDYEALSPMAQQAIENLTSATKEEAAAAKEAAGAYLLEATALDIKNQVDPNGTGGSRRDKIYAEIDAIMSKYQGMIDNMSSWTLDFGDTSSSTAGSTKDAWVEAFKEEQRQLKHSLEMNEITELEYYDRLKDLNEKYFGEISGKHKKYIKEYQENEEEIYKGTKAVYDKVKDYLKEAIEQGYEKAINALKKEEKEALAEIKKNIEALKREKKHVLDNIKSEINALKKQKEQVQKYYNDQIDAIKKENEVLEEQNQLLEYQQQLQQAKAQKVMVFQEGKFQLGENESAVAQAEQNLSNYKDQLSYEQQIKQLEELRDAQVEAIEARIQSLEEYYDYMEDYYDRQIEAMEDYYDRVQEQYEKQIEALQEELDTFKEGYKKAEDLDNARLAAEVMAANEEASVWRARLDNLAEAISEYNRLLSLMGEEGVYATSGFSGGTVSHNAIAEISGVNTALEGFKSRASGDASFASNEVALVGESPNTELVLGSKLNHSLGGGELVHLSKGSGVVNAESTRTLAGLLNGLANPQSVSSSRTTQQTFNFGSISLPNVTNAETFVGALRDKFNNYSIQSTTVKK